MSLGRLGVKNRTMTPKNRYILYQRKDLNSPELCRGSNKSEMKKLRTQWKYQMMLPNVTGEIFDTVTKEWIP